MWPSNKPTYSKQRERDGFWTILCSETGITNSIQTWNRCYTLFCLQKLDFSGKTQYFYCPHWRNKHKCVETDPFKTDVIELEQRTHTNWDEVITCHSTLVYIKALQPRNQRLNADWDTNPHINIPGSEQTQETTCYLQSSICSRTRNQKTMKPPGRLTTWIYKQ